VKNKYPNYKIRIQYIEMKNNLLKRQIVMFVVMVIIGILFNPMNILANRINDLYLSLTLFYGGLLMASNMIWGHEIVHYLLVGKINIGVLLTGLILSILVSYLLLRGQFMVNDKEWLKRMISHHSTALTTSKLIKERTKEKKIKNLAEEIIETQEREILKMKSWL
tara:strand:- start:1303 stop:1797 length:495 start_codon:yes stop_codon:yes gene_type:complete